MTPDELKAARAALGMTQPQFAAAVGVPLRSLQNWEIGWRNMPRFTAEHIRRAITETLTKR